MLAELKQERMRLLYELDQLPICEHHYTNKSESKTIERNCEVCRAKNAIGKLLEINLVKMRKAKGIEVLRSSTRARISPELRKKMIFAKQNGLRTKEIAQKFKVSESTVRRYVNKAKELIV